MDREFCNQGKKIYDFLRSPIFQLLLAGVQPEFLKGRDKNENILCPPQMRQLL